ncbi:hypothetical protein B0A48_17487 [Cryoendolithus antarcticus]|uniref:Uncharacterized protein n=1 Tax=Cryoendolithus antarcticus TaxID=1507870 RepID=A0A1V8SC94_9PEZI|nr:hypothetical protein B0A48_17487 [Cryoendolithus antarcticus]
MFAAPLAQRQPSFPLPYDRHYYAELPDLTEYVPAPRLAPNVTSRPTSIASEKAPSLPPRTQTATPPASGRSSPVLKTPDSGARPPPTAHKSKTLAAYLVPLPCPTTSSIPRRFILYTPPAAPLSAPANGTNEPRLTKLQRKWEAEVREAKESDAKFRSWKGVKGRATKGIDWGMSKTKGADVEFLTRVPSDKDEGITELNLIYPQSMAGTEEEITAEVVESLLRSHTKAKKDAIIATGLLPVTGLIDLLATPVWPFGGLLEVDAVWLYASVKGKKASGRLTTGLAEDEIKLSFTRANGATVVEQYLAARCHETDRALFPSIDAYHSETDVLEAIGWTVSSGLRSHEDMQWEIRRAQEDVQRVMRKAAKEWRSTVVKAEQGASKAS